MPEEKLHSDGYDYNIIKKLTLPDGFRVGIRGLDKIIEEVIQLNLTDAMSIKTELLTRVKASNYVARSAEKEYQTALFREYQRILGIAGPEKTETHRHTAG